MNTVRDLLTLATHTRPERRREMSILVVGLILSALADSASIITLSAFLSTLATQASTGAFWTFAAAILCATGLRYATTFGLQHFGQYLARDLMVDLQARILGLPYEEHFSRHSADLIALPVKVEQLVFGLVLPVLQGLGAIVTTAFVFATLYWIDGSAAVAALFLVAILYAAIAMLVRRRIYRAGQVMAAAYSDRVRVTQESVGGLRDLIIDGTRAAQVDHFDLVATRQAQAGVQSAVLSALPRHAVEALGIAAVAALFFVSRTAGAPMIAALPVIGAFALAGQRLLPMAQSLYQGWSGAVAGRPLLDEVCRHLALPAAVPVSTDEADLPFDRGIELRGISYRYPNEAAPALCDIHLTIRKGEYVAIAGKTGAGKSTLADVIMGLLPAVAGEFLVDGETICRSNVGRWQRHIAHVPQSPFLADSSLAANIALVPDQDINRERLDRAISLSGLSDVVAGLANGAQTLIGEQGVRLSGGQQQRVALARAVYRQASLLVLDEATNALDDATEDKIRKALLTLRDAGTTILVIAHRGGPLDDADRVVCLNNGRVLTPTAAQATH